MSLDCRPITKSCIAMILTGNEATILAMNIECICCIAASAFYSHAHYRLHIFTRTQTSEWTNERTNGQWTGNIQRCSSDTQDKARAALLSFS